MKNSKKSAGRASFSPRVLQAAGLAGCVLLLILWHLFDVKDGAAASGAGWLLPSYGLLAAYGLALLLAVGWLAFVRERLSLERFFLAVFLGTGLMFLAVLPPLSAPDEVSHYISAYQLSNRLMGKEACTEDGRVLIRAQDAFIEDVDDVMKDDGSGPQSADKGKESGKAAQAAGEEPAKEAGRAADGTEEASAQARVLGQELTQETYRFIRERGLGGAGTGGEAVSYQLPVRTTPLAYVPQALGITLARILGLGGLGLLYMGRLFNLAFLGSMGYLAMRRLPFGREVLFGVYMLPMTLHLAASLSYDVMIIGCSGYFGAVCLDLAFRQERVRPRDVILLALVLGIMGPCKMVYGVIAGYCLLIPVRKFGDWKKWTGSAALVLGAFALSMFLVNRGTVSMYVEATDSYMAWAGEEGYTLSWLVHNPKFVLKMCYDTLAWKGESLFTGMMGGALGNLDPVLNTPFWVILAMWAILWVLALAGPGERGPEMSMGQKAWIWFLSLACLGALMFSMLLGWTPVSATKIEGVQGRYLLPLLPMLLLTVRGRSLARAGGDGRMLLFGMTALDVYVIVRIFAVVCLRVDIAS